MGRLQEEGLRTVLEVLLEGIGKRTVATGEIHRSLLARQNRMEEISILVPVGAVSQNCCLTSVLIAGTIYLNEVTSNMIGRSKNNSHKAQAWHDHNTSRLLLLSLVSQTPNFLPLHQPPLGTGRTTKPLMFDICHIAIHQTV